MKDNENSTKKREIPKNPSNTDKLKMLERTESQLIQKVSFLEKQAETVKAKMRNLLLNIKKIANDSIHRKSKVFICNFDILLCIYREI